MRKILYRKFTLIYLFLFMPIFCPRIVAQEPVLLGSYSPGNIIIGQAEELLDVILDKNHLSVDATGLFIFGFDRDDKGTHFLRLKFKSGQSYIKRIVLKHREYDEQKIENVEEKYITPPDSLLNRISLESQIIEAAEQKIGIVAEAFYKVGFIKPVKNARTTSVFGTQRILTGIPKLPHNGIDLAAPKGTPVYAMTDGKVLLAEDNFYYRGNFIVLDHGQGLISNYFHLSKSYVKVGQTVSKGDLIGEIGSTGRSTGPHLHWGVLWHKKRIDPSGLLKFSFKQVGKE